MNNHLHSWQANDDFFILHPLFCCQKVMLISNKMRNFVD